MPLNFHLVDSNPNDVTGGGGTLAGPMKDADDQGPYFVWPAQEFESAASPYCVVSAAEVDAMTRALRELKRGKREVYAGGESSKVRAVTPTVGVAIAGAESREFDLTDPDEAEAFVRELHAE